MNKLGSKLLLTLAAVAIVAVTYTIPHAAAATTSCIFSLSPNSVAPGTDNYAVFSVTNNSGTAISSVVFTSPDSQKFTILSNSAYRWQGTTTSSKASFTGGTLNPGQNLNFTVEFSASATPMATPLMWTVAASDDPTGLNPTMCSGDGSLNIVSQPSSIAIANVGIEAIADTEATIAWTTDIPATSQIQYGRQSDYGQSTSFDSALVTDHYVIIKNLTASTTYHYQVMSTTPDGGAITQGDNTFLTAVTPNVVYIPPITTPKSPTVAVPAPITAGKQSAVIILKMPTEKIAPTVAITTKLPTVTKILPLVSGIAQDNNAVARVEYSLNGGKSWLATDTATGLGGKQVSFTFTTDHLDDANYRLIVRAIDTSGNIGTTQPVTVVIDRLPPIFSNLAATFGPQAIESASNGTIGLAVNGTYRVTGQAVGGATIVTILARNGTAKPQSYSLVQDSQSGLWSGSMSFNHDGTYRLSVHAKDGAGNVTDRQLGLVQVTAAGKITNSKQQTLPKARITLFYLEPVSRHWVVWDGAPYGQTNPQLAKQGSYGLMVPAGEYYIKATNAGYRTVLSRRFKVNQPTSINQSFKLSHIASLSIRGVTVALPSWPEVTKGGVSNTVSSGTQGSILGSPLPQFKLPSLDGGSRQKIDLFGKPTDLTLLDTWSPSSIDQLGILANLQRNQNFGIVPVFEGQSAESAHAYAELANLTLSGLADPDNSLAESLQAGIGPRHIFIDRTGHIKKLMVGVLSEQEIIKILGGI